MTGNELRHAYGHGWHKHTTLWWSVLTFQVISLETVFDLFFTQIFSILNFIIPAPDLTYIGLSKNTLRWIFFALQKIGYELLSTKYCLFTKLSGWVQSVGSTMLTKTCALCLSVTNTGYRVPPYWGMYTRGPFYWHWITYTHYGVWVKLLIHSQTSTLKPLKFGQG